MASRIRAVPAERRAAIASQGGAARAEALAPADRSAIARTGAAATNSPLNYAQRIRRKWADMSRAERAAVREVLTGCSGLFPRQPKKVTVASKASPRKVAPPAENPNAGA
jgi:hypothetical protein